MPNLEPQHFGKLILITGIVISVWSNNNFLGGSRNIQTTWRHRTWGEELEGVFSCCQLYTYINTIDSNIVGSELFQEVVEKQELGKFEYDRKEEDLINR